MTITTRTLTGIAGLAAIAAGLIFIVIQFIHPPEDAATVTTVEWAIVSVLTATMAIAGISGLYLRNIQRMGVLALPMGVALAALGLSLWRRRRDFNTQSDIGPLNAQLDPVGVR